MSKPSDPQRPAHTKGPWSIGMREGHNANTIYAHIGKDQHDDPAIASVFGLYSNRSRRGQPMDSEAWANARLIADAPDTAAERDRLKGQVADLLGALKEALPFVEGDALEHGDQPGQGARVIAETIRVAIQRVEQGTTPSTGGGK